MRQIKHQHYKIGRSTKAITQIKMENKRNVVTIVEINYDIFKCTRNKRLLQEAALLLMAWVF